MKQTACPICNKLIRNCNLTRHIESHNNNKPAKLDFIDCPYCGKTFGKLGIGAHKSLCKQNPNHRIMRNLEDFNAKGNAPWNKGLTKETDARVKRNAESVAKTIKVNGHTWLGRHHTLESRFKIAKALNGNTHGNRSKKGYYKDIFCGSTYELAYVIYCLDHNIDIKRCDKYYNYEYKGKSHLYFPDFIVDNTIIEIKGYHTELVDIKVSAIEDMPIKVLYKKDLADVFNYVFKTYNVNIKTITKLFTKQIN